MEGPLKELTKLEKLTAASGKTTSIADSLDSLLKSLRDAKEQFQDLDPDESLLSQLSRTIEGSKRDVDERQKEVYSSIARLGKALDKVNHVIFQRDLLLNSLFRNFLHPYPAIPSSSPLRILSMLWKEL